MPTVMLVAWISFSPMRYPHRDKLLPKVKLHSETAAELVVDEVCGATVSELCAVEVLLDAVVSTCS